MHGSKEKHETRFVYKLIFPYTKLVKKLKKHMIIMFDLLPVLFLSRLLIPYIKKRLCS